MLKPISFKWFQFCLGIAVTCWAVFAFRFINDLPRTIERPETLGLLVLLIGMFTLLLLPVIVRLLERAGPALFYGLVLTCPLDIGKSWWYIPLEYSGPHHEFRLTIALILLVMLTIPVVAKAARRTTVSHGFNDTVLPVLLLFLLSAASCFEASNVSLALFELFRMATNILLFFVVTSYVASERPRVNTFMTVIAVAILIHGAVAIIEQQSGTSMGISLMGEGDLQTKWGDQNLARSGGLMGYPTLLAPLMLLYGSVAGAAGLFLPREREWQGSLLGSLLTVSAVTSLAVLVITYTRSAWIALVLGIALALPTTIRLFKNSSSAQKRRVLRIAAVFFIAAVVAGASLRSSITERLTRSDSGSAASRVDMMKDAVAMIQDNWLTGVGLNNYSVAMWRYDVTGVHRWWGANVVVHNLFLLIAAETGIPSLVIFCLLIYRVLRKGRRSLAVRAISPEAILIAGLGLGIICFLIQSCADASYRFSPGLQRTLWLFMGLLVGYAGWSESRQECPNRRSPLRHEVDWGSAHSTLTAEQGARGNPMTSQPAGSRQVTQSCLLGQDRM